jgi:small-conductance mechanosensitive channel
MQWIVREKMVLSQPAILVGLAAFLTALLVQSGELGSIDTEIRLQTTHSFWTGVPAVPEFGVAGKNGRIYATYGMGQSLVMLPSDVVGSYLERLRLFAGFAGHDPGIRQIVVSYSTNILVCVLTVLMCLRFLRLLEFTVSQAVAGALTLLFGTTFLHYTQNMMENNLILLLTLTGLTCQYDWLRTGRTRSLVIGSLALGANLLVRLTTAIDIIVAALFVVLVLWLRHVRGQDLRSQVAFYIRIAGPCYALFLSVDRIYQYQRFGSFLNTYLTLFAEQQKKLDSHLPLNFPWSTPLREGLLGPLITAEKSVFLFDPLIVLTLILSLFLWRRLHPDVKAFLLATLLLLAMYIFFYAKYYDWSGDFAWGDRYVTTPVHLLAMISIPLLLRHRLRLGKVAWWSGVAIASVSVAIQLASIVFWHPLEIHQMETLGHPTFVVGLRFENIAAVVLGKVDEWGLSNEDTREIDDIHANTPYFLPFLLQKDGSVSEMIAEGLIAAWLVVLGMLIAVLLIIRRKART